MPSPAHSRVEVLEAIRPFLPLLERAHADVRIVGTASSCLRGIDLPVGDIDILGRERAVIDVVSEGAIAAGGRCLTGPEWLQHPDFGQYFSAFELAGVRVEVCTVEPNAGETLPFGECDNDSPWTHFDEVLVDGYRVPLVASELRLFSEVAVFRARNWVPIAAHLASSGYDEDLVRRAIEALPPELHDVMREAITPARGVS